MLSAQQLHDKHQSLEASAKALNEGLGKTLNDLRLADQFPSLVNLDHDLSESRRRQAELFQLIQEEAALSAQRLDLIWRQYQQELLEESEEELLADERAAADRRLLMHNYLNALTEEEKKLEALLADLEKQVHELEGKIHKTEEFIRRTLTDTFDDLVQRVGDQRFALPEREIHLRDVINFVRDGLLHNLDNGSLTAENLIGLRNDLIINYFEVTFNINEKEKEKYKSDYIKWTEEFLNTETILDPVKNHLSLATQQKKQLEDLTNAVSTVQQLLRPPLANAPPPQEPHKDEHPHTASRSVIHTAPKDGNGLIPKPAESPRDSKDKDQGSDLSSINLDDPNASPPSSNFTP